MFESFRVQDVHARGARVELHIIATVFHDGFARAIVQLEFSRDALDGPAGQRFRNVGYPVFHPRSRGGEQIARLGALHGHAALKDESEGF